MKKEKIKVIIKSCHKWLYIYQYFFIYITRYTS